MDVNMHPTKREVGFLHQEELIQALCSAVEAQLLAGDSQYAPRLPWQPLFGAYELALVFEPCQQHELPHCMLYV